MVRYGTDTFEIATDAIKPNSRVLIVDDLLATGGSFACAVELIRRLNVSADICGCFALMNIGALSDQVSIALKGVPVGVLIPD